MSKKKAEAVKRLRQALRVADELDLAALNVWSKGISGPHWCPITQEYACAFRLGVLVQGVRDALQDLEG